MRFLWPQWALAVPLPNLPVLAAPRLSMVGSASCPEAWCHASLLQVGLSPGTITGYQSCKMRMNTRRSSEASWSSTFFFFLIKSWPGKSIGACLLMWRFPIRTHLGFRSNRWGGTDWCRSIWGNTVCPCLPLSAAQINPLVVQRVCKISYKRELRYKKNKINQQHSDIHLAIPNGSIGPSNTSITYTKILYIWPLLTTEHQSTKTNVFK